MDVSARRIGAFQRTEISSEGMADAGIGASTANGVYTTGDARFELQVIDMAAMGALAALGGALATESNKETAAGYERTGTVDGRMTTEEWSTSDRRGKYLTVVANRFTVQAEGTVPGIDTLKGAVAAVDRRRLEALAR